MKLRLSIILLLFVAVQISSQSLQELISEGLSANNSIKSGMRRIEMSRAEEMSVDNYPAPVLNIEISQIPFSSFDLASSPLSQSLSVSQMIPAGGKPGKMREMKKAESEKNLSQLQSDKNSLAMKISDSYYQLWLTDQKLNQNEKYSMILESIRDIYKRSAALPGETSLNLLMLENEISVNTNSRKILETERRNISLKIKALLGRSPDTSEITAFISPADTTIDTTGWNEESLFARSPEISTSLKMKEMYKAELKANDAELIPDVMIGAMLMRMPQGMLVTQKMLGMYQPGMSSWKTEYMYSLIASVTLPFVPWSAGKITHKEESLLSGLSSVDYEIYDMKKMLGSELNSLKQKALSYSAIAANYRNSIILSAELVIESRKLTIATDSNSVYSILSELKMLNMAESDLFMYTSEMLMSKAGIEIMLGKYLNNGDL